MKEIYDKSVEKIAKYSDELSDIDPYVFDKAIPLIRRELQDIIKSHTLAFIDAEIENVMNLQAEHANTARHGNTPDDAYDRVIDDLRYERNLISNQ